MSFEAYIRLYNCFNFAHKINAYNLISRFLLYYLFSSFQLAHFIPKEIPKNRLFFIPNCKFFIVLNEFIIMHIQKI